MLTCHRLRVPCSRIHWWQPILTTLTPNYSIGTHFLRLFVFLWSVSLTLMDICGWLLRRTDPDKDHRYYDLIRENPVLKGLNLSSRTGFSRMEHWPPTPNTKLEDESKEGEETHTNGVWLALVALVGCGARIVHFYCCNSVAVSSNSDLTLEFNLASLNELES